MEGALSWTQERVHPKDLWVDESELDTDHHFSGDCGAYHIVHEQSFHGESIAGLTLLKRTTRARSNAYRVSISTCKARDDTPNHQRVSHGLCKYYLPDGRENLGGPSSP